MIQFEFWKSNSTIDAILYLTEFFRVKYNNNYVACLLLNLIKLFDFTGHRFLQQTPSMLIFSESLKTM